MSSANHHLGGGPSRFSTAQPPPASHQPHDTDTDADLFDDLDEDTYRALYETETQYLSQYATIPDTSQHASISVLSISSEDPLPSQDRLQSHGEISMLRNNLIQAEQQIHQLRMELRNTKTAMSEQLRQKDQEYARRIKSLETDLQFLRCEKAAHAIDPPHQQVHNVEMNQMDIEQEQQQDSMLIDPPNPSTQEKIERRTVHLRQICALKRADYLYSD